MATFLAAAVKSFPFDAYKIARDELTRVQDGLVRSVGEMLTPEARATIAEAWANIVSDPLKAESYKSKRGMGGFVRARWEEVNEIIAGAKASGDLDKMAVKWLGRPAGDLPN